ncbi:hypothetical protein D9758_017032 [Tetrapyrgos nigripes]|uniref:Uncharacterized protein n=1 Tax=Tetrapyrgos nigripes TaxID=182062 RepID=A0A8H5FMM6_9AGAR|nr:hypothetical protein D9758_017032 [Tetrapyrgos nigripes]
MPVQNSKETQSSREYKLVIFGNGDLYVDEYDPTVEDSYRKQCVLDDEIAVLDILDTAGQEDSPYYTVRDSGIHSGEGFLLVYAITSRTSFEFLNWVHSQIMRAKSSMSSSPENIPILIVGNKCDLEDKRQVGKDEGQELARRIGCQFLETSAKEDINVDEAFYAVVREIKKHNQTQKAQKHIDSTESASRPTAAQKRHSKGLRKVYRCPRRENRPGDIGRNEEPGHESNSEGCCGECVIL